MSKAVLISIRPEWCKLIVDGKKTVEVRKSRPKLETPFKVYIYCTAGTGKNTFNVPVSYEKILRHYVETGSMKCLYLMGLYCWHISDLVIYDKPKELSEFTGLRNTKFGLEPVSLVRPPQSWCYVEELGKWRSDNE